MQTTEGSSPFQMQFGGEGSDAAQRQQRFLAHKQRCKTLPPVSRNEADALVAQFLAKRGGVTQCPTAYLVPVR